MKLVIKKTKKYEGGYVVKVTDIKPEDHLQDYNKNLIESCVGIAQAHFDYDYKTKIFSFGDHIDTIDKLKVIVDIKTFDKFIDKYYRIVRGKY